jgi:tRNA G18 (ribose-2'-O)-methylase SpoU
LQPAPLQFHSRGTLGCGVVPPPRSLAWLRRHVLTATKKQWRIVAVDGGNDHNNLGSIVRCSSAFGVDAILLSGDCCSAWYRAAVRVSMGHVFRVPVIICAADIDEIDDDGGGDGGNGDDKKAAANTNDSKDAAAAAPTTATASDKDVGDGDDEGAVPSLAATLLALNAVDGVHSYAAVIDDDATLLHKLPAKSSPRRWCVVVGNEHRGISDSVRSACQTKLRIDMHPDVDSFAINVAAAIVINGIREREVEHNVW